MYINKINGWVTERTSVGRVEFSRDLGSDKNEKSDGC
jgi:hypothetical protein